MELKMPDLGEGVTEGEINKWLVKEGDTVKEDQVVLEVMTDKATVEIPTFYEGKVVKIVAKEGDTVPIGKVLAHIGTDTSTAQEATQTEPTATSPTPTQASPASNHVQTPPPSLSSSDLLSVQAAPIVRRQAQERGLDISTIRGTGPNGRILLQDLEGVLPPTTPQKSASAKRKSLGEEKYIPLRGLRKQIVKRMAESKKNAAHFTCVEEVDVTEMIALKSSLKEKFKSLGTNLSYMPFIIKASQLTLLKFPSMNASLEMHNETDGQIIEKKYYNFGIAVDTPKGLTVPVIPQVDKLSLVELSKKMNDIAKRAQDNKLTSQDFKDSTFTITNAGKVGGLLATPIINYPEVSILGIHEIRKRPVVVNNDIKIRDIMHISVSIDHRVVDGATGILFLNEVKNKLQDPKKIMPKDI